MLLCRYEKEQDDIKHLKAFINSCGTFANLRKQADSKQKIIDKMVEAGLTEKVVPDPIFRFGFPNSEKLPPPVLAFQNVSFAYSGKKEDYLYTGLEFGIDCDSRIALVGPNGAGKSTLLKLMEQEILPSEGRVQKVFGLAMDGLEELPTCPRRAAMPSGYASFSVAAASNPHLDAVQKAQAQVKRIAING